MINEISNYQYETLSMHATYSFLEDEGNDASLLLCELAPNINNIEKYQDKKIK